MLKSYATIYELTLPPARCNRWTIFLSLRLYGLFLTRAISPKRSEKSNVSHLRFLRFPRFPLWSRNVEHRSRGREWKTRSSECRFCLSRLNSSSLDSLTAFFSAICVLMKVSFSEAFFVRVWSFATNLIKIFVIAIFILSFTKVTTPPTHVSPKRIQKKTAVR